MPFTPAGAWKHVNEVLKLDVPKEDIESFDFFWTASINFAALESWAKNQTTAPDGNNSGMYNLMYLWIEMADAAQNGALPDFPSTEYAAWRANDKLTALSARRFAIHALHSMGFKFIKPNLINHFHTPDRTFLLQFPMSSRGADITPCNGNWLWCGEAAPIAVVNEEDICADGGLVGDDTPSGVGSPSPTGRQLPDNIMK